MVDPDRPQMTVERWAKIWALRPGITMARIQTHTHTHTHTHKSTQYLIRVTQTKPVLPATVKRAWFTGKG